jgi:nicotinamidase/pyrazinamidase
LNKPRNLRVGNNDALIVTDIQNDFLPGGALPVREGDQVIPMMNEYIRIFKSGKAKIIISRDWHPKDHISFKSQGGSWPPHCVQNTTGSEFSPDLKIPKDVIIVSKATDPAKEAYSVFDGTDLASKLKTQGIQRVFIGGLATDYCVKESVLHAMKLGFQVAVLIDGIRGIDAKPGDVEKAMDDMMKHGATPVMLGDFPEVEALAGEENPAEVIGDEPLTKGDVKKKARMRPKGSYKQVRRERG